MSAQHVHIGFADGALGEQSRVVAGCMWEDPREGREDRARGC